MGRRGNGHTPVSDLPHFKRADCRSFIVKALSRNRAAHEAVRKKTVSDWDVLLGLALGCLLVPVLLFIAHELCTLFGWDDEL